MHIKNIDVSLNTGEIIIAKGKMHNKIKFKFKIMSSFALLFTILYIFIILVIILRILLHLYYNIKNIYIAV